METLGTPEGVATAPTTRGEPGGSDTLRALVRAASRLWYEKGYSDTSMQELVLAAGVTKGAFYHHFRSKEDLLKVLHDEFIDYELRAVRAARASATTARAALIDVICQLMESVEIYREEITVFIREMGKLSPENYREVKSKRDELGVEILELIEQGMRDGEFVMNGADPKLLSFGIVGMCAWAHEWFDRDGPTRASEIGRSYALMVLDGIGGRE